VKGLVAIAARSSWNRRFALGLVVASIALSTLLLLGMERVRKDVRAHFAESVSGTDLIAGARSGSIQLLLYSVFRIGSASNNISWESAQALASHPAVAWTVPISLGDSHRGFPVVATSSGYFDFFRFGDGQPLRLATGRRFDGILEAVLGSDVARDLGYREGERIVLSHGDGVLAANDHADKPFVVVGTLHRTGTPVDRSIHINLESMEALHRDWVAGAPPMGGGLPRGGPAAEDLTPRSVTAVLVGLKNRSAVFAVQRWIAEYRAEPLQALMPGIALEELWEIVGAAERALLAMGLIVSVVGIAGMVAVILAGLNERRRELAILRAVGAAPRHIVLLLALEAALITLSGVVLGALAAAAGTAMLGGWFQSRYGIALRPEAFAGEEWLVIGAMLSVGLLAGLLPGFRAYRLSLADGLSPRV
jgi:putative ABC transport system permease protein